MTPSSVFEKILYIGPDLRILGGISSVLRSYRRTVEPFHFLAVNSHRGHVAGYFSLLGLMLRLPFARLKGRKAVHIHYASGKSWVRESHIMSWARLWGYKTVMHCHAGMFAVYAAEHPDVRKVLAKSDINVVLSPKWKRIFSEKIGVDGTRSINNIVAPSTVAHLPRRQGDPAVFTFIGDILERKGVYDLIDAADRLPDDANFSIEICGRGETDRLLSRIAASPHADRIHYRGPVNPAQRDELLSRTAAVVLPSHAEGVPIVILEGMAAGTGVIATDVGGITDIVTDGQNGFVVNAHDTEALAEAMKRYIDDPALTERHAAESAVRVAHHYPEAVSQSLIELYKELF